MVWFQCEDCGENLKKPKLPYHFRICSANKLSCIDCGEIFNQQSVQGHTQCITEAEKYGPKDHGKSSQNGPSKTNKPKKNLDVDVNVGLSSRAPWFCSLCKTKATSQQTLLLHADGKKHRAKAKAFQASQQKPDQAEETAKASIDSGPKIAPENFKTIYFYNLINTLMSEYGCQNPDGFMKTKKLQKHVLKTIREDGVTEDKSKLQDTFMHKITSSSRFVIGANASV
ncbi:hypothetical protein QJS10_CPA07g01007 [Acorus calamus]|uniref:U1-type domain-containing protein n=1 Tax=Acorus calamus TaxID=4465 RepID=A0AAV9EHR2_ACOCL|nr:hypothetical protein QJS10_CPA07g01007 [Acorus calamus]